MRLIFLNHLKDPICLPDSLAERKHACEIQPSLKTVKSGISDVIQLLIRLNSTHGLTLLLRKLSVEDVYL